MIHRQLKLREVCSGEKETIGAAAFGSEALPPDRKAPFAPIRADLVNSGDSTRRNVIERDEGTHGHPVGDLILRADCLFWRPS